MDGYCYRKGTPGMGKKKTNGRSWCEGFSLCGAERPLKLSLYDQVRPMLVKKNDAVPSLGSPRAVDRSPIP